MQISRAILGQDQKLRLPKFLEEEEKSPEATKQVGCKLSDSYRHGVYAGKPHCFLDALETLCHLTC